MRASFTDLRQRLVASGDNWPGLEGKPLRGAPQVETNLLFATPPPLGSPRHIWPVSAWTSANSSGVFNRGQQRFFNYAALYAMVEGLARLQEREIGDDSNLVPFETPQKLDPSALLQLLRDLGAVDADNAEIERLAAEFVGAARQNGIPPAPDWLKGVVRGEALSRGMCVKQVILGLCTRRGPVFLIAAFTLRGHKPLSYMHPFGSF